MVLMRKIPGISPAGIIAFLWGCLPQRMVTPSKRSALAVWGIAIAVSVGYLAAPASVFSEEIPAKELLVRIKHRTSGIVNIRYRVNWMDSNDGVGSRYNSELVYADELGRKRVQTLEVGEYGEGGAVKPSLSKTHMLFDGEKNIVLTEFEKVDAIGNPLIETIDGKSRHAVVSTPDARLWNGSSRSPMMLGELGVTLRLEPLAKLNRRVEVISGNAQGASRFTVRFPFGDNLVEAVITPEYDWAVTGFQISSSSGRRLQTYSATYVKSASGVSYPKEGILVMASANPKDVPKRIPEKVRKTLLAKKTWQFTVEDVQINDRSFDESVFEISVPAHTNVSDARFGVSYYVGDDDATDAILDRLAAKAAASPTTEVRPFPTKEKAEPWLRSVAMWVVSFSFIVICMLALSVRWFRR